MADESLEQNVKSKCEGMSLALRPTVTQTALITIETASDEVNDAFWEWEGGLPEGGALTCMARTLKSFPVPPHELYIHVRDGAEAVAAIAVAIGAVKKLVGLAKGASFKLRVRLGAEIRESEFATLKSLDLEITFERGEIEEP